MSQVRTLYPAAEPAHFDRLLEIQFRVLANYPRSIVCLISGAVRGRGDDDMVPTMSMSPIPPVLDQDRYAVYQPTAATTDFALGFPLFGEASDVAVYLDGTELALTTDYTVRSSANGASLTPAPVSDAYVRLNSPISTGVLEIFGNFRPRRTIQASAPYGTRDFNFAFSLLMAALREMWSKFTRALKVPVGEPDLTIPSSADRAGQVLAFDDTGKPVAGGSYSAIVSSVSAAADSATNAAASAEAAALSAAAAQIWDPENYFAETAFVSDGTPSAPVKYRDDGGILTQGLLVHGAGIPAALSLYADTGYEAIITFYLDSVAKWQWSSRPDGRLGLYNYAVGAWTALVSPDNVVDFSKLPTIAGVPVKAWDLVIEDQRAAGVGGGTSFAASWNVRTLNTVLINNIGAVLSSSIVTFPPGTYDVEWDAPTMGSQNTSSRLYNVTDGAAVAYGSSEYSHANYPTAVRSFGRTQITLAAAKQIRVDSWIAAAYATYGLGAVALSGSTEVYSRLRARKLS